MENLNKENFWNELFEKYPKGVQVFCDWIDEYKKENNWDDLFGNKKISQREHYWANIKFHHLPYAMQIGLWIEFVCSQGGCEWQIYDLFSHDWREEITQYCQSAHQQESI